jgi:hypothetical protein
MSASKMCIRNGEGGALGAGDLEEDMKNGFATNTIPKRFGRQLIS